MTTVSNKDGTISTSFSNLTAILGFARMSDLDARGGDVNGHVIVAIADRHRDFQGFDVRDPAQMDFIAGDTYVSLQGYKSNDELVRIAKTM